MKLNHLSIVQLTHIFIVSFFVSMISCIPQKQIGKGGVIESGTVTTGKCTKPQKRYTKDVKVALKGSVAKWKVVSGVDLEASVKSEVTKLTDYSQVGLDLDLILFRICEMSRNASLTQEQTGNLTTLAMKTWNGRMSVNEQKNIISQLKVELASNLKTANELKLNTETILSNLNLISGEQILRNPKIQILPLLFPLSNLRGDTLTSVSDLVIEGLTDYQTKGLDTNQLEKQKFSSVGKAIAMTIEKTLPTFNSLSDREGTKYQVYSSIWNANTHNLSKIEVFDITKFQQTYSELNSLKTNYNIVVNRATDYLADISRFFNPEDNKIKTRTKAPCRPRGR